MKKKKLFAILAVSATLCLGSAMALTGCGDNGKPDHEEHTYAEGWSSNETHHWHAATCEDKDDLKIEDMLGYGAHVYDDENDTDCNVCGKVREVETPDSLGTLTGKVTAVGTGNLAGATVSIGGKSATTGEDGSYTVNGLQPGTDVAITITHPACNDYTGTVNIVAGSNTLDQRLTPKGVTEIGKTYLQLQAMEATDKTDFPYTKDTALWETYGHVDTHGEGTCLVADGENEDMVSVLYQKIAITSANSKMMFRVRGFGDSGDCSLAVRVVDLAAATKADLKAKGSNEVWQTMDSRSYFISYEYDLSAYEGKDVVIMIGAKSGHHNVVERIKFAAKTEEWLMPYTTASDLAALGATAAPATLNKEAISDASWVKVGDQQSANEGWLFKDGPSVESGSTDLCVFTYKKLTFDGTNTVSVRARTFADQSIPGKPNVPAQIVLKVFDSDGQPVEIGGNCYTIATDSYQTAYFSLGQTLTGDYTFVIGIARGHRLAVEEVAFLDTEMTKGTVTGTVKCGTLAIEGAEVTCGAASVTTNASGEFSIPVQILSGSATITVAKQGYGNGTVEVTAENLASGSYEIAEAIQLDKTIIGGITMSAISGLTAEAAANIDVPHSSGETSAISDSSWIKVGGGNHMSNEGWLIRGDDRYVEDGSTDINGYVYKKLAFSGVNTITVRARTFGGQNSVTNHGQIPPQIVVAVIDGQGNLVTVSGNCYTIATDNYETGYFSLGETLTGDYTFVVGIARGRVIAIDQIQFKTEKMVKGNLTGTVTDGTNGIADATVSAGVYSVKTDASGAFTLPVEIFPGNSLTVKVEKSGYTYAGSALTVAATELESGSKALGSIALDREIIKGLTKAMIDGLTAVTPENISAQNDRTAAQNAFASWGKVGSQDAANEGWLLKDAGDAESGSTDLQVYVYKKFTLTGVNKITVSGRTFNGQNSSNPEIVIAVIGSDGQLVSVTGNCHALEGEAWGTGEFTLPSDLSGDYTVAIGFARGQRLAIGNITFEMNAD